MRYREILKEIFGEKWVTTVLDVVENKKGGNE